jgi:hypothetical protein
VEQQATAGLRLTEDEADVVAEFERGPLRVESVAYFNRRAISVMPV